MLMLITVRLVQEMFLVVAMGPPGGGRTVISERLLSRFNLFSMTFPQVCWPACRHYHLFRCVVIITCPGDCFRCCITSACRRHHLSRCVVIIVRPGDCFKCCVTSASSRYVCYVTVSSSNSITYISALITVVVIITVFIEFEVNIEKWCWLSVVLLALSSSNKMLSYRRETALHGALQFSPKVEHWNGETIFYGHYRSL